MDDLCDYGARYRASLQVEGGGVRGWTTRVADASVGEAGAVKTIPRQRSIGLCGMQSLGGASPVAAEFRVRKYLRVWG